MDDKTDYGDIAEYIHDTQEQIQKCLNCDKPECTNCLWGNL